MWKGQLLPSSEEEVPADLCRALEGEGVGRVGACLQLKPLLPGSVLTWDLASWLHVWWPVGQAVGTL